MKKHRYLLMGLVIVAFIAGFYTSSSINNPAVDNVRTLTSGKTNTLSVDRSSITKKPTERSTATPKTQTEYVLNKNTKKFHKPNCSSVKQMKEKNKEVVTWSRQEIIDAGYDPCGRCHP